MKRDERIYAFIVAQTSRTHLPIRRVSIHKRWLKVSAGLSAVVLCAAFYGLYSLSRQAAAMRLADENSRLRMENEHQRRQLNQLKNRVEAVEDATRRIADEIADEDEQPAQSGETANPQGAGGPLLRLDAASIAAIEQRAAQLERALHFYETALRERERIPSVWPVEGRLTDDYGGRGNPFGGGSFEFHSGLDIATAWGTPVVAAGGGTVSFAGTQSGYGQMVVVDHGNGLTSRYGHLSKVEVVEGQQVVRGQQLGRVGSTGRSTGPHLHYEVRIGDTAVNPRGYLPERAEPEETAAKIE